MLTYFDCNYPFQYGQWGGSAEEHIFTCVSTKLLTTEEMKKVKQKSNDTKIIVYLTSKIWYMKNERRFYGTY